MERLQKSILQTLAYFDIFDCPLTKEELFRLLYTDFIDFEIDYPDFFDRLEHICGIETKHGFYFLPGREKIIEERQRRIKFIEEKMKIANPNAKFIHPMPVDEDAEVTREVNQGPRSIIVDIAENRLHVQKAIMALTMAEKSK